MYVKLSVRPGPLQEPKQTEIAAFQWQPTDAVQAWKWQNAEIWQSLELRRMKSI